MSEMAFNKSLLYDNILVIISLLTSFQCNLSNSKFPHINKIVYSMENQKNQLSQLRKDTNYNTCGTLSKGLRCQEEGSENITVLHPLREDR